MTAVSAYVTRELAYAGSGVGPVTAVGADAAAQPCVGCGCRHTPWWCGVSLLVECCVSEQARTRWWLRCCRHYHVLRPPHPLLKQPMWLTMAQSGALLQAGGLRGPRCFTALCSICVPSARVQPKAAEGPPEGLPAHGVCVRVFNTQKRLGLPPWVKAGGQGPAGSTGQGKCFVEEPAGSSQDAAVCTSCSSTCRCSCSC